jgi:hypothetical protein
MIDLYVINLEKRKDRWEHILKTFSDPEINLIRVDALEIEKKRGWFGCFESHKKCIRIAKEKGLKNIMVIEDDCLPMDSNFTIFKSRLEKIKNYLDTHDDWNIYLGGTATFGSSDYDRVIKDSNSDETFVEFTRAYMTHMIAYNSNCYDLYLDYEIVKPVDEFWFGKIKALVSVPFLATQLEGYSDIVKRHKSDTMRIKEGNQKLIKYLNNPKNKK